MNKESKLCYFCGQKAINHIQDDDNIDDDIYICDACDMEWGRDLDRLNVSEADRTYICGMCGKKFVDDENDLDGMAVCNECEYDWDIAASRL